MMKHSIRSMFCDDVVRSNRPRTRSGRDRIRPLESLEPRLVLAGDLVLAELLAVNNTSLTDADGDHSDWIEVFNPQGKTMGLEGWYLTDQSDRPTQWQFPDVQLEPGESLIVFASGKDRSEADGELHTNFRLTSGGEYLGLVAPDGYTVASEFDPFPTQYADVSFGPEQASVETELVGADQSSRILMPTSADDEVPSSEWASIGFDDTTWQSVPAAVGYDQDPQDGDFSPLISPGGDLSVMNGQTASAYLRSSFQLDDDFRAFDSLNLQMNYDDGFVAYLNGTEVARRNAPDELAWNSTADQERGGVSAAVNYPSFSDPDFGDDFTYLGDARWTGTDLRLTPSETDRSGAAWLTDTLSVGPDYSFSASMRINAHSPQGQFDGDGRGGDGMTFVLQSGGNTRLGGSGGQLGLDGTGMTFVAVEFDTFATGSFDPDDSLKTHLGINTSRDGNVARVKVPRFNGDAAVAGRPGAGVDLRYVWITYDGSTDVMDVYFADVNQQPAQPTLSATVDLETLFGGVTDLWTGFTASTGAGANTHDVSQFQLTSGTGELGLGTSSFNISSFAELLRPGDNVLAIHGLNLSAADEDFLLRPRLFGGTNELGAAKYFSRPSPGEINGPGDEAPAGAVMFSEVTKTFVDAFDLTLSTHSAGATIRYTTNGSLPTETSTPYTGPIRISSSTRIRARAFADDMGAGPVHSEGFIRLNANLTRFDNGQPFESNLPIMVFDSFGRNVDGQDTLFVPVTGIFISPGDDGMASILDDAEFGGRGGMRIRGQTSQGFPKKQYAVELWDELNSDTRNLRAYQAEDKAASFFGLPAESDWVLNGPYSDKTQLNNYLSFLWSNEAGLYAPRARLVEVFVNQGSGSLSYSGDYRGTYVLLEKIKIDGDRVDLAQLTTDDNREPDISGGYIWKKDKPGAGDRPFRTSRGQELRMVEPDDRNITTQQKNWLQSYINDFEAALYGPGFTDPETGYANYIDVGSWVDTWLLVEMTKNIDGFRLSTYYHKDRGGKIEQGPAWDFNLSLGNGNYLRGAYPDGWYHRGIDSAAYPYWDRLFEDPNFEQRVVDRWHELRSTVWSTDELLADVDEAVSQLSNGNPRLERPAAGEPSNPISRNFDRWGTLTGYLWPNCYFGNGDCPSSPLGHRPRSYGDYIDLMKNFVEERTAWIDTQFPAGPTLSPVGGSVPNPTQVAFDVPAGWLAYYTTDGSDPRQPVTTEAEDTLFASGTTAQVLVPSNSLLVDACRGLGLPDPDACFMNPDYALGTHTETWTTGRMGVGYDENTDYDPYIRTDVGGQMNGGNTSVYVRIPFDVSAKQRTSTSMDLRMRYDDGFVAYLWSPTLDAPVEIARANAPGSARSIPINALDHDAASDGQNGDSNAVRLSSFDVSDATRYLRTGENYLVIQGLNANSSSSDFLIDAELVLSTTSVDLPPNVRQYSGPLTIDRNTEINARLFRSSNSTWSALTTEVYLPEMPELAITEINYNPADPTVSELAQNPLLDNDDFEYIELLNVGTETADLVGSQFATGVEFDFPSISIAPGEHGVLVKDRQAFEMRYGDDLRVLGEYAGGSLNNGGESITLVNAAGQTLIDVSYDDDALWPARADGVGGTLQLIDETGTPVDQLGKHYRWRGSTEYGGSPGRAGEAPLPVVINEILSHTDPPITDPDSIELHHVGTAPQNIGGWYLSDSANDLLKYRIPANTPLQPGEYIVFDETHFNPTPLNPAASDFSLSGARGDDVWLTIADADGLPAKFVDDVHFPATANGESLGRTPDGAGRLAPMRSVTLGSANTSPRVGPLLLSEIQYQPASPLAAAIAIAPDIKSDDLEFIEVSNPTGAPVDLTNWRIRGGVDYEFVPGTRIAAGESILVVSFDVDAADNANTLAAFRIHFGIPAAAAILGGYRGQLSDQGERVALQRPDDPPLNGPNIIPHMLEDEVIYDNLAPWPTAAAGNGLSLQRLAHAGYGNDATSWTAATPSPGHFDFEGAVPGDFNGDGVVDVADVTSLCTAIRTAPNDLRFDLSGDGMVDIDDHTMMIQSVLGTNYGDANLDGRFNSADLIVIFQAGEYQDSVAGNSTWSEGDWNCDGDFDTGDLILAFQSGAYETPAALPLIPADAAPRPSVTDLAFGGDDSEPSVRRATDKSRVLTTRQAVELDAPRQDSLFDEARDRVFANAEEDDWKELDLEPLR